MKNRIIYFLNFFLILVIVCCIIYLNKLNPFSEEIYNKIWYNYNYKNGFFETFKIEKDLIYLNTKDDSYKDCKKYKYDQNKNTFKLECGKSIEIKGLVSNKLYLKYADQEKVFFNSMEDTINYEFENYFEMSINEYKKEKSQVKDLIKINFESFNSFINEKEQFILIIETNNCINIECILINDIIEKWITKSKNIYYINIDDLDLNNNKKIKNLLSKNNIIYNEESTFPQIIKKDETVEFVCDGFDCRKWNNYIE